MEESKKEKKPKSKLRKILDWVITCVFAGLFLFVAAYQIISNSSKKDNYGVPTFAGQSTLVVLTDSMEPQYEVGTAVFIKKVDPSTLKAGDDVTFYYSPWKSYMSNPIVTHRIIDIQFDETKVVGEQYTITVHGINTDSDNCHQTGGDRDCTDQTQVFTEKYLVGKVTGSSKFVGGIYKLLSSWYGLLIMLLIPCLYLIVTSVLDIFKALKDDDTVVAEQENNTAQTSGNALDELSEEDRERLKQELLNEMMGGSNDEEK